MSKKLFISNSPESVRLFKSSFLEFSSKSAWYVSIIFGTILSTIAVVLAMTYGEFTATQTLLYFILGFIIWSPLEYIFHRFVFHYEPTTEWGKKRHFLIFPDFWTALIFYTETNAGYSIYEQFHYHLHHVNFFKKMKKYHLAHHYTNDNIQYGVSPFGMLWDIIFRTNK